MEFIAPHWTIRAQVMRPVGKVWATRGDRADVSRAPLPADPYGVREAETGNPLESVTAAPSLSLITLTPLPSIHVFAAFWTEKAERGCAQG